LHHHFRDNNFFKELTNFAKNKTGSLAESRSVFPSEFWL